MKTLLLQTLLLPLFWVLFLCLFYKPFISSGFSDLETVYNIGHAYNQVIQFSLQTQFTQRHHVSFLVSIKFLMDKKMMGIWLRKLYLLHYYSSFLFNINSSLLCSSAGGRVGT